MRTIIVDDDPVAVAILVDYCQKIDSVKLINQFVNPLEALDFLKKNPVDLILLDIEMPELNGIELVNKLDDNYRVIVTTTKSEYAYDAFKINAIDFLVKPINFPAFQKSIKKAEQFIYPSTTLLEKMNCLYIREKGRFIRIDLDDILYFENVRDYVCIKTLDQSYAIVSTLKQIVPKLPSERFLKIHRSYIVNLDKIKDIDDTSLIISGKVIPISRINRPILLSKIYCL